LFIAVVADISFDKGALVKLDASDNSMFGMKDKTGIIAWVAALKACTSITTLNLAKNGIDGNDTKILAPAISDMGALTSLNVANNNLGQSVPPEGWTKKAADSAHNWSSWYQHTAGMEQKEAPRSKPEGIIAIANAIKDMGAITRLNISNNQLCGHWKTPDFSGFKALAAAIEQHKLLTMDTVDMSEVLDVAGQNLGTAGAKMMATFIKGNGALSQFVFSGNGNNNKPVTMKISMTEADFSAKGLGESGAIMAAAFLPKCT
jgi:hypothetical protein